MPRAKHILAAVGVVVLGLIGVAAWTLRDRTEEIPETLEEVEIDPMSLRIPDEELPELALAELKGSRVLLMLEDKDSWQTLEGRPRNRAINRWILPDDVRAFYITDLKGFELFKGRITKIMGSFRPEMRYPSYLDFKGALYEGFKMPRGHSGTIILDAAGELAFRHSGPLDEAQVEEVKGLLEAREPPREEAPDFVAGDLSNEFCRGKVCVLAFLSAPVKRSDIPGGPGGFRGDREEGFKKFSEPSVRLAGVMERTDGKVDRDAVEGVIVGELEGFQLKHWSTTPSADEARAAFKLPEGEDALVIVNKEGEVVLRESGLLRFYQFGTIADHVGVDEIEDGSQEHRSGGPPKESSPSESSGKE